MRISPSIVALTALLALATQACTGSPMCVPDGQPACQCTPDDSRACNDNAGNAGLQVCDTTGLWSSCLPFAGDGSATDDATTGTYSDVQLPDFGGYMPGG